MRSLEANSSREYEPFVVTEIRRPDNASRPNYVAVGDQRVDIDSLTPDEVEAFHEEAIGRLSRALHDLNILRPYLDFT